METYYWKQIKSKKDLPEDDSGDDYPEQHIVRGFDDNSRGHFHVHVCQASEIWDMIREYDWADYLVQKV